MQNINNMTVKPFTCYKIGRDKTAKNMEWMKYGGSEHVLLGGKIISRPIK